MRLLDIYNIIRNSQPHRFYNLYNEEKMNFIYSDDVVFQLVKLSETPIYGYSHFYDDKGHEIELQLDIDKLVKRVCKVKNFPDTYNIMMQLWGIKYSGQTVYTFEIMEISNPSSLDVVMPPNINTPDYIFNICEIMNTLDSDGSTWENVIVPSLKIKPTSFEDFLQYRRV